MLTRAADRVAAPQRGESEVALPPRPRALTFLKSLEIFKRAGQRFLADDCMGLAQQIAYNSLLVQRRLSAREDSALAGVEQRLAEVERLLRSNLDSP